MRLEDFKRIVTAFADQVEDVDTRQGRLVVQIRDEVISARLHDRPDGLLVEEHGARLPAVRWIVNRLAQIPLLADRICSYVTPPEHFVAPSGRFLDQPDRDPAYAEHWHSDVGEALIETLGRRPGGMTSLLYLTSDAGAGKTSLIHEVAVRQAREYKAKRSGWLLLPIPLAGGTFFRFDDAVITALVNGLRFPLFYHDAFLELVRLGVLVPAFDGSEEMDVEFSSEAVTALGNLVGNLESAGTLLVATRKAYFDDPNFRSQTRLFDAISADAEVAFGRFALDRWSQDTFVRYAGRRGVPDPSGLFAVVSNRLGSEHPVLTRAVLARRLVDVATEESDLSGLLDRIGPEERDCFRNFVGSIVEREALSKWTDESVYPRPLLTIAEHHLLLAMVAQEMWLCSTDEFGTDVFPVVAEIFAERHGKGAGVMRQIRERIRHHALLAPRPDGREKVAFEHDVFRIFYLGKALGQSLVADDAGTAKAICEKAPLPALAVAEAAGVVRRRGARRRVLTRLQQFADGVLPTSFVKENCGILALALLDGEEAPDEVRNLNFPLDALRERHLTGVTVSGSCFRPTVLPSSLRDCRFVNCRFDSLEIPDSERVAGAVFEACSVGAVVRSRDGDDPVTLFDPQKIERELREAGFDLVGRPDEPETDLRPDDEDLILTQRFLRAFLRANALNEETIRKRLGTRANHFVEDLLPRLQKAGVVQRIPYRGAGDQRRLRLRAPRARLDDATKSAGGQFDRFLDSIGRQDSAPGDSASGIAS